MHRQPVTRAAGVDHTRRTATVDIDIDIDIDIERAAVHPAVHLAD